MTDWTIERLPLPDKLATNLHIFPIAGGGALITYKQDSRVQCGIWQAGTWRPLPQLDWGDLPDGKDADGAFCLQDGMLIGVVSNALDPKVGASARPFVVSLPLPDVTQTNDSRIVALEASQEALRARLEEVARVNLKRYQDQETVNNQLSAIMRGHDGRIQQLEISK